MIEIRRGPGIDQTDILPGLRQGGTLGNAQPDHLWGDPALGLGLDVEALRGQLGQIVPGQARCQDEARGLPRLGTGVDSLDHTGGVTDGLHGSCLG